MTLLSIIGGQPAPNLLAFLQLKPSQLVLIHTEDSVKQAEDFRGLLLTEYGLSEEAVRLREFPATDPAQIQEKAAALAAELCSEGEACCLNYTGGPKPLAVQLYLAFRDAGAELLYVDTQEERMWRTACAVHTEIPFSFQLRVKEVLFLKGTAIKEIGKLETLMKRLPLCRWLAENRETQGVKSLLSGAAAFRNAPVYKTPDWRPNLETGPLSVFTDAVNPTQLEVSFAGQLFPQKKRTYWAEVFAGGWLEDLVCKWLTETGEYDDVQANVKIRPDSGTEKQRGSKMQDAVKNEIDVMAVKNAVPLFAECKAGRVDQKAITNLFSIMETYGPRYRQGALISWYPVTNPVLLEKLRDYGITLIQGPNLNQIEREVKGLWERIVVRV